MKKLIVTLTSLLFVMNIAWAASPKTAAVPNASSANLPRGYITSGGLTWSPVSDNAVTLAEAKKICASSTALGYKWRLPAKDELVALHVAYRHTPEILRAQGWTLTDIWSSTPGSVFGTQFIVNLDGGIVNYGDESNGLSFMTCVN